MAKAELEIVVRGKPSDAWARYDAVIEAAKAWHAEHKEHDNEAIGMAIVVLARAIEALQEVE